MKRILFICLVLALAVVCYATVNLNEVNHSNVNAGNFDQYLRGWINTLNQDIANGGSLFNVGTGKIFYVDSGAGSSAFTGLSADRAKATLNGAVGLCEDNRGDLIYVLQGHSKTMGAAADEVDLDVAGITVVGLGNGTLRPLFDYTGDVTGAFAIGAANITIRNCVFNANTPDVNEAIEIEAAGDNATIQNCEFTVTTADTDEFTDCIELGDAADGATITGCKFVMAGGAAVSAIHLDFDTDGMTIINNIITGDYSTACINGDTTASTNLIITGNILMNGILVGDGGMGTVAAIVLLDSTAAIISHNDILSDVATNLLMRVADDATFIGNWVTDTDGDEFSGTFEGMDANSTQASQSVDMFTDG